MKLNSSTNHGTGHHFLAAAVAFACISAVSIPVAHADATLATAPAFTKQDLATANGSARIGAESGNLYCVLTSIESRVELSPDRWASDDEAKNWTTWLTTFDDNLYAKWEKNAKVNAQETVGIKINADGSVNVTNGTFFPSPAPSDPPASDPKASFEQAIATSLDAAVKAAKTMPETKNKLKEIHMSLTFMREPKVVPRYGKNALGFVAVRDDKNFITVSERTKDGRFPGIQILGNGDNGKIDPLEQDAFDQKIAELEKSQ